MEEFHDEEPGFQKLSKLLLHAVHAHRNAIDEREHFECLAKTRVNTPPMAKMTYDVQIGSYVSADSEVVPKSASGKSALLSAKPVSDELPDGGQSTASHCHIDIRIFEQNFDLAMIKNEG